MHGVAERRMRRDVIDQLAVDIDLPPIAQRGMIGTSLDLAPNAHAALLNMVRFIPE
jgi:histidine ammonia-lyase